MCPTPLFPSDRGISGLPAGSLRCPWRKSPPRTAGGGGMRCQRTGDSPDLRRRSRLPTSTSVRSGKTATRPGRILTRAKNIKYRVLPTSGRASVLAPPADEDDAAGWYLLSRRPEHEEVEVPWCRDPDPKLAPGVPRHHRLLLPCVEHAQQSLSSRTPSLAVGKEGRDERPVQKVLWPRYI